MIHLRLAWVILIRFARTLLDLGKQWCQIDLEQPVGLCRNWEPGLEPELLQQLWKWGKLRAHTGDDPCEPYNPGRN